VRRRGRRGGEERNVRSMRYYVRLTVGMRKQGRRKEEISP